MCVCLWWIARLVLVVGGRAYYCVGGLGVRGVTNSTYLDENILEKQKLENVTRFYAEFKRRDATVRRKTPPKG